MAEKLPRRGPLSVRLWARVEKSVGPDGCWLWTGSVSDLGYGRIRDESGRSVGVHCAAYELEVGPIPDGLEIDHLCRVRNCVNPAHLEPVTHAENHRRRRGFTILDVCKNGHPLEGDNLYLRTDGRAGRECRACRSEAVRRHRQKVGGR
jgi:hypothetical protein